MNLPDCPVPWPHCIPIALHQDFDLLFAVGVRVFILARHDGPRARIVPGTELVLGKKQNNLRVNSLVWKFNSHFFPLRVNPFLFLRLSIFLWLSKSFHDFYIIFLLVTPLLPTKTITGLESNPSPESKYLLMACPSSDFLPMPCRHVECGFTFAASRYWMGRAPSFSNRGVKHGKASPAFHPKGSAIGAAEVCL